MKAATYHKSKNDNVDWINPISDIGIKIDKVYASKLFNYSDDYLYYPPGAEIIKGGTGFDIKSRLPEEIEKIRKLDYSIYPQHEYSMQFFSRGCIRNCPFCVVREKEGYIHPVEPLDLNPKGKHIEVLDNNFFANTEWKKAIEQLLKWGQPVNMQGVDVRIMNEEQAYALNKLKHFKQIHIAWDNPKQDITENIKAMVKHVKAYKIMCYVLIGYWSTPEEDLYRIEKLRELKVDPLVMPFNKKDVYQNRFTRWVNHKAIFKSVKWSDYR
jgi:pyruvate-formate lyase-activating enzyme